MSKIEDSLEKAAKQRYDAVPVSRKEALPAPDVRVRFDEEEKQPHLKDYIDVLLKRKWIVLAFLIPVVLTVAIVSFVMEPIYKSTAIIHIKDVNPNVSIAKEFYHEMGGGDYYETQYNILKSRNIAERVINVVNEKAQNVSQGEEGTAKETIENISIGDLMKDMEIVPVKKSQLVNVIFESHNPLMAAVVPNTVADEYIAFTLESKLDPTEAAKERLEKEVADMRAKLEESEQKLNDYIAKNQIYLSNKENAYSNSITEKISDLTKELNMAVAERLKKEAIYQEVQRSGVDYSVVLNDSLIKSLTKEYIDLESQYSNLLQIQKPEYPKMIRLKEQMEKLKERIAIEEQKILNTLSSDYQLALKKEKYLTAAIEKLRSDVSNIQDKIVQIQIFKREVDTNSVLYNALLQRLKEIGVSTALTESNVQVLDRAEVPRRPFKPDIPLNIALGLIFGLFGGIFLAFTVEYFDQTIKTPEDIEKKSSLPILGMVPVTAGKTRKLGYTDRNAAFSEAFRSLSTFIQFTKTSRPPRQVLFTSPLAGEGKTLLSVNAALSLSNIYKKGIIIDADLRRPNVHTHFKLDNSVGLSSYLTGKTGLEDVIRKSAYQGLDVMTGGPIPSNPSELLNSSRMKELLDNLTSEYNYVIVDSAPVLGLADSLILSTFVESVIVVVKAGHTPEDALDKTKKTLHNVGANILGVVVNGVDIKTRYGSTSYTYHDGNGNGRS